MTRVGFKFLQKFKIVFEVTTSFTGVNETDTYCCLDCFQKTIDVAITGAHGMTPGHRPWHLLDPACVKGIDTLFRYPWLP